MPARKQENMDDKVTCKKQVAQGDLLFIRVEQIPEEAKVVPHNGTIVVAHSETQHHHAIEARDCDVVVRRAERDPFTCYLQVACDSGVDVVHHRAFDTHATVHLPKGMYIARRQREYEPEGYRMVMD